MSSYENVLPLQPAASAGRRLAAIAFVDIVGYTSLLSADEDATLREWSALQNRVIEPLARTWHGHVLNRAGDGLLLEFRSALEALRWAVAVQKTILPEAAMSRIALRIALHLGDIADAPDGQTHGEGVAIASRLQAHARAGGVIVSGAIAGAVGPRREFGFSERRSLRLRGVERPIVAYAIDCDGGTVQLRPRSRFRNRHVVPMAACLALVLSLAAGALEWPRLRAPSGQTARADAARLLGEGRAIVCKQHPCAREWLQARALYERAIRADPAFGPPYAYAAMTYTNFLANGLSLDDEADLSRADELASQALALAPEASETYQARGAVLSLHEGRLQEALAAYEQALALDPTNVHSRANIGLTLLLLGKPGEAEPYLRQAIAQAPRSEFAPAWLTYLGLCELFLERPGHGEAEFRDAIAGERKDAMNDANAIQRSIDLAAAIALNGRRDAARAIVDDLRVRHPTLSLESDMICDCSTAPGFLAGAALLRRGLRLASLSAGP